MAAPLTRSVYVNLDCEYTRTILINALAVRAERYVVVKSGDEADVQWAEYESIDWDKVFAHSLRVNWYCIRKGLIRKAQLAHYVRMYTAKHPDSILSLSFPETYPFELDDPEYLDEACYEIPEVLAELEAQKEQPVEEKGRWIVKPSITNKASDVYVFDSYQELEDIFTHRIEEDDLYRIREFVVQRYISNPMKLFLQDSEQPHQARKFHIRTYVLAVGSLDVYVLDDMLALFAMRPYTVENLSDSLAHLTNTCVSTEEEGFREEDMVRLFWELDQNQVLSKSDGSTVAVTKDMLLSIFTQIKAVVAETFRALVNEFSGFQPLPQCFELYGFDFLVDENLRVFLLEANAGPDFARTGARCHHVVDHFVNETVRVALDEVYFDKPEERTQRDEDLPWGKLHKVYGREGMMRQFNTGQT